MPSNTAPAARARRLLLAALAPTAITLVYEWTTGTMPANWIRALAGVPLGAAVAWLIGTLNDRTLNVEPGTLNFELSTLNFLEW